MRRNPASITVCGHSLGAAVATLLAVDIAEALPGSTVTLVTLASPCVGTQAFAGQFNKLGNLTGHRLHITGDIVVAGLALIGFAHVGEDQEFDTANFKGNWICEHILSSYQFVLSGRVDKKLLDPFCR